ncbi:MAG: PPC domain-containing DNA-binding protein [Erysipelotrichaceae bacterium]
MFYAKRLKKGDDLKRELEQLFKANQLKAAVVISAVGCLNHVEIRLAKGKDYLIKDADYEIVSLNGTLSVDGSHLHIALSDSNGNTVGGHLCYNCIVNTTCELVIQSVDSYCFSREFDETTGYKEIVFKKE